MKNKGLLILSAMSAVAVSAAVFDYVWEKRKEERKNEESLVFQMKPEQVKEISLVLANPSTIKRDGQAVVTNKMILTRGTAGWAITSPIEESADQEAVRSFIETTLQEKASPVGSQQDITWSEFGLEQPRASVTIKDESGKSTEVAVSSRKNFQGEAYLRRDQENKVLLGSMSWYPRTEKQVFDFRDKRPFRFSANDIKKIRLQTPKAEATLELNEAKWMLSDRPKWKLDQSRVREVLGKITGGSLIAIQNDGKLGPEDLRPFTTAKTSAHVEIEMPEKKLWSISIVPGKDGKADVYISEPPTIASMSAADGEKLLHLNLDDLRDRSAPFEFKKTDIQKIELKSARNTIEAEMKNDQWQIINKSDPALNVDGKKVGVLVDRLQDLEALEFLDGKGATNQSGRVISMKDASGQTLLELTISESQKKKINGIERLIVTAKSNLLDEPVAIEENKIKDLGLDEMLSPPKKVEEKPKDEAKPPGQSNEGQQGGNL